MPTPESIKAYVGKEHAQEAQLLLASCDQSKLSKLSFKNPKVSLVLSVILGFIGIDRLYQGGVKMFACKLVMMVLTFGTWWIADFYYTKYATEEANYEKLLAAVA